MRSSGRTLRASPSEAWALATNENKCYAILTLSRRWIRPTGNCRPALAERLVGFFLSPLCLSPMVPLAPFPDRPLAPFPDMVARLVVKRGNSTTREVATTLAAARQARSGVLMNITTRLEAIGGRMGQKSSEAKAISRGAAGGQRLHGAGRGRLMHTWLLCASRYPISCVPGARGSSRGLEPAELCISRFAGLARTLPLPLRSY